MVLYSSGLVSGGFAALHGLMYFVLVSAALAVCCLVLYSFELASAGFAVLCVFIYFALVSAAVLRFVWFCMVLG